MTMLPHLTPSALRLVLIFMVVTAFVAVVLWLSPTSIAIGS